MARRTYLRVAASASSQGVGSTPEPLGVELDLGLGAARADLEADLLAELEPQQACLGVPAGVGDGATGDLARRVGAQRSDGFGCLGGRHPQRHVRRDVVAVLGGDRVETVLQGESLGLGERSDLRHHDAGGDAVLVERPVGDEVAERLLVPEHEPQLRMLEHRVGDPLEAGERLGAVHAVPRRHPPEQRRRHERRDHEPVVAGRVPQDVVGEQRADLVAA